MDTFTSSPTLSSSMPDIVVRPNIITALCGYYFITIGLGIFDVIFFRGDPYSESVVPLVGGIAPVDLVLFFGVQALIFRAMYGYWMMKRGGVYLFVIAILVPIGFQFLLSPPFTSSLDALISAFRVNIVQILAIWVGFKYLHLMKPLRGRA